MRSCGCRKTGAGTRFRCPKTIFWLETPLCGPVCGPHKGVSSQSSSLEAAFAAKSPLIIVAADLTSVFLARYCLRGLRSLVNQRHKDSKRAETQGFWPPLLLGMPIVSPAARRSLRSGHRPGACSTCSALDPAPWRRCVAVCRAGASTQVPSTACSSSRSRPVSPSRALMSQCAAGRPRGSGRARAS